MRLRTEISMVLCLVAFLAVGLTTWIQARYFARDQEAYLNDFQSALARSRSTQLRSRNELLREEIGAFLDSNDISRWARQLPGVRRASIWSNGRRIAAYPASQADEPSPENGVTGWAVLPGSLLETYRWIGRYEGRIVVLELGQEWMQDILSGELGGKTELVANLEHPILSGWREPSSETRTKRFELGGETFLGAYSSLGTDPPAGLLLTTEWEKVSAVVRNTYWRSAGTCLALFFACLATGLFFSARLTKPLSALELQMKRVGEEDFSDFSAAVGSHGELGTLARGFNRMISDLRSLRARIAQQERLAALGEFSAGVAHEVKNPLSGIIALSEVVERMAREPKADLSVIESNVKLMQEEARRANTILTRLMQFARHDTGPLVRFDLARALRQSTSLFESLASNQSVTATVSIPNAPVWLKGNREEIQQVVLNLLQNALYAVQESPERRVTIALSAEADRIRLEVADTGTGIDPETQKKIFEPFFTTKPIGEGTGLGLAVCHGIVARHMGRMRVESEPGKGSRFIVELPTAIDPA